MTIKMKKNIVPRTYQVILENLTTHAWTTALYKAATAFEAGQRATEIAKTQNAIVVATAPLSEEPEQNSNTATA